MILRCIAIDDEPLALGLITSFIEKTPFLDLAGTYASAIEALDMIGTEELHLIFLDIHMPELNGMEFSKMLSQSAQSHTPRIIFTTAFNQFAIEGYQVDALYYLLKPFNYSEFLLAANKGKFYFEALAKEQQIQKPVEGRYLYVKSDYKIVRIELDQIRYIESIKDYIKIHVKGEAEPISSLATLKSIEERLPDDSFLRLHRSFIVSIQQISALGRNSVYLGSNEIPVGDLYRDSFKKLIGEWENL